MYDLLIRGGTVVDGTGNPGYRADVALSGGLIAEVGQISGAATRTIDATDLTVAPGIIDNHTHYDAQVSWDSLLTPSCWHGVTSVIMGNCGVGVAPCRADYREPATWDLVNVEGIPYDLLKENIDWQWETFPEYLDAMQRGGLGVNVGAMLGMNPVRHYVLGEESTERASNPEEVRQIQQIIREAMEAGALGFSTSKLPLDIGYKGVPVSSRLADMNELRAYAEVLGDMGKGVIQLALSANPGMLTDEEEGLIKALMQASNGRPMTWLALLNREDHPEACMDLLARTQPLIEKGAVPQIACRPLIALTNLIHPFVFGELESWKPAFDATPEEQKTLYRDESFRAAWREDMKAPRIFSGEWERVEINSVGNPRFEHLVGKTIRELEAETGKDGSDLFLDLALEDDLKMDFRIAFFNTNEERVAQLLNDPRTLLGLSDGGAHLDMLCDAGFSTYLLGHWVREKQALSLEKAVHRITQEPAKFFGIKDRGVIEVGKAADITIFDHLTVGSPLKPEIARDLPGGGLRMVTRSTGVEYTVVNGEVLFEGATHTGAMPGQIMRS
ncbi:MAG: amidohydrolase family protein [Gammaproteobacteria bacterium]|nr:amidohydrolase family protein [Gammaproteobacteria bacterium]